MPDALSQSQIDALLKGITAGEIDEVSTKKNESGVKEYDFYSPKKFTKEQLRNLENLHENLGRVLSSYFSGVLRVMSEVTVLQVDEERYYEYNNALPDSALMGLLEMRPHDKNLNDITVLMNVSPNIAYFMIDRFLGGQGGPDSVLQRDFTDIERAIMHNVFERITQYMTGVWSDYLPVEVELGSIETNPRLVQVYAPEDIVIIALMKVKLRDLEGTITFTLPGVGVEEMLGEFASKYSRLFKKFSDASRERLVRSLLQNSIYDSPLELRTVFAQTELELNDVLRLKVDDVIPLHMHPGEDVSVKIGDATWFSAQLGTSNKHKAIKLTDTGRVKEEKKKEEQSNGE